MESPAETGPDDGVEDTAEVEDETTDETAAEVQDETAAPSAEPGGRRRWPGSPRQRLGAAVLAALLAVSGYDGWLLFNQHRDDVAAAHALDAATKFALVLTSMDSADIDREFTAVLDGSTGQFKDMYTKSSAQLRQLLLENKAEAHGTVLDAAVKSASPDKVVVLLFIDQSVRNKTAPGPQLDRSRVSMTMQKVDGHWLASEVNAL